MEEAVEVPPGDYIGAFRCAAIALELLVTQRRETQFDRMVLNTRSAPPRTSRRCAFERRNRVTRVRKSSELTGAAGQKIGNPAAQDGTAWDLDGDYCSLPLPRGLVYIERHPVGRCDSMPVRKRAFYLLFAHRLTAGWRRTGLMAVEQAQSIGDH